MTQKDTHTWDNDQNHLNSSPGALKGDFGISGSDDTNMQKMLGAFYNIEYEEDAHSLQNVWKRIEHEGFHEAIRQDSPSHRRITRVLSGSLPSGPLARPVQRIHSSL